MSRRAALAASFLALGLFSLSSQTSLFREYLVVYSGNELGTGFFFASWLLWVGIGAMAALALLRRRPGTHANFPAMLALYPVALLLQLLLIRSLRSLAGVAPTDLFPTRDLFLLTFLTNAPVSFVTGLLFPVGARAAKGDGTDAGAAVSRVYALECLGSFAGGAGVTWLLLAGRGNLAPLPIASAAVGAAGLVLALRVKHRIGAALNSLVLTVSVLLLLPPVGKAATGALDRLQWRSLLPAATLTERCDTPYRRLDAATLGEQTLATANGELIAAWPGGDAALGTTALLMTQPERTRRALVVSAGIPPLLIEMLRYPVEEVVLLEPDGRGHEFLLRHAPEEVRAALTDPRVRVVHDDPRRRELLGSLTEGGFDLVIVDVGDPATVLASRVFTREFYESVKACLAPGGVFATSISSAENYFGTELTRYGASVLATLEAVWPRVVIAPGEQAWFLAGPSVSVDPDVLETRLESLEVQERRFAPERIHGLLESKRVAWVREVYGGLPTEERAELISTDARPITYLLNLLVLGRVEGAGFTRVVVAIRRAGLWIFLLPALLVLLVRLRYVVARPNRAASARFTGAYLLALTGGASIALALVLLLGYQERFGLLFAKVGLANALFLLGLFVGGTVGSLLAQRGRAGLLAGAAGLVAAAWALLLPLVVAAVSGETAFLALFLLTGTLCGAPFPLAAALLSRAGTGAGETGGVLEASDHLGGAAGAALAGVLLVPLFGAASTARFLGLLLVTAPLLLALERVVLAREWPARMRASLPTFPYVRTGYVLFAVVLASAAIAVPVRRELDRPRVRLSTDRLRSVVLADRYHEVEEPFLHYDAWREGEATPLNHTLASRAVVDDVTGFAGPLNLLVSVDHDGKMRKVALLESKETPAYIAELPEFLSRFAGQDTSRGFRLVGRGEDADPHDLVKITGATITCRAAVETVNRARGRVLTDVLGLVPPEEERPGRSLGETEIVLLVLFVLAVAVFLRGGSLVRTLFLVVVLAVAGFVYNQQLSAERVTDLLALETPPAGNLPLLVLVGGVLALSIAFGQIYCGVLCPFGAAQELLGKFGLTRRVSPEIDRRARFTKHVVLTVTAVGVLLGGWAIEFDPLAVTFSLKASRLMCALIALVLVASVFYFRFWCRYLCPVGAFLSLFNRVALLLPLARPKDYRRCDIGVSSKLDLDCLHCNRCIARAKAEEGEP